MFIGAKFLRAGCLIHSIDTFKPFEIIDHMMTLKANVDITTTNRLNIISIITFDKC